MHENRETSETPAVKPGSRSAGEGDSLTARTYVSEESHNGIVPMNYSNNDKTSSAESGEGRPLIKENAGQPSTHPTQSGERVSQGLAGVRKAARENKEMRFTALLHHLTVDLLRESFYSLKRKAAPGVDGVTWHEYEAGLEERLIDLHGRVHRGAYRALPSRRVYIQKEDGRQRPLGVAALEDKIVQQAVVTILNQIYEEDFLGFSYGFRPGRSQHDALDALSYALLKKKVNYILDADIRGFFENLDKGWMIKFVEHRVADPRILRLIQKWLKAGVMEEGKWSEPQTGTAQGSVISPWLANVYLHYSFDLWVNVWRQKWAKGEVVVIRYADDSIAGFQYQTDAIVSWRISRSDWLSLDWSYTRTRRAGSNSAGSPKRTGDVGEKGNLRRSISWALPTSVGRTAWDGLQFGARRSASAYGPSLDASSRSSASECTIPCPKPGNGSNRSCKATSTTTRYQATPLAYPCSGTGCLCSGGIVFAAAARSAGFPGPECLIWQRAGYLHRKCSIPIPMPVLPLLIRDKNRMR